jgi:DNA-binding CsgD family transcriptional regulator
MARRLCAAWDGDGVRADGGLSLPRHPPTAVLDASRDLHREWHALVRADPDMTGIRLHRRVVHPRNPALTASVTILCPRTQGLAGPVFVLEFERRVHGFTLDPLDDSSAVLHAMTPSERAVASELADGLSNQDIADRLGKTVSAVKFLLHRIYQKTGVPNRAALVALLRPQKAVGRRAPEQSDSPPRPG